MPIDPPEPRDHDEADTDRHDHNVGVSSEDPAEGADDVSRPQDGSPEG